jgi:hypothetical protein
MLEPGIFILFIGSPELERIEVVVPPVTHNEAIVMVMLCFAFVHPLLLLTQSDHIYDHTFSANAANGVDQASQP